MVKVLALLLILITSFLLIRKCSQSLEEKKLQRKIIDLETKTVSLEREKVALQLQIDKLKSTIKVQKDSIQIVDTQIKTLTKYVSAKNVREKVEVLKKQISSDNFSSNKEISKVIKDSVLTSGVPITILSDSSIKITPLTLSIIVTGLNEKDLLKDKVNKLVSLVGKYEELEALNKQKHTLEVDSLKLVNEKQQLQHTRETNDLKKEVRKLKLSSTTFKILTGAAITGLVYIIVK